MSDVYGQFLRFEAQESAVATLTEGNAILTGAHVRGGAGGIGIEIHDIFGQLDFPEDNPSSGANEYVAGAISTRSGLTTIPNLSDEHCLYRRGVYLRSGVATYLPLVTYESHLPPFVKFNPPLLVTHQKLYPYVLSSNSSDKGDFKGYLFYNYVDIDGPLAIEALESFR